MLVAEPNYVRSESLNRLVTDKYFDRFWSVLQVETINIIDANIPSWKNLQ